MKLTKHGIYKYKKELLKKNSYTQRIDYHKKVLLFTEIYLP